MYEKKKETEYSVGGSGNVFTDRLYSEFPNMKGEEVSEEEFEKWKAEEGFE